MTAVATEPVLRGPGPHADPATVLMPQLSAPRPAILQQSLTALIVFGPVLGVVAAAAALFDRGVTVLDLALAVVFYAVTGHGLSAGYHRMFSHRSFKASRWLKVALAIAGSLAFEGSVNSWVANHRRHHAYTDRAGDPHSPYAYGTSPWARTRGAAHAHLGWLFQAQQTEMPRWAPDLVADPDLVRISRLFPVFCVVSLALPTLIGGAVTGSVDGAVGGFVWGGLVRIFLLHHSTFAVNSACHLWGKRPYETRSDDRATNFAPLAVLAMGDNWHNLHHSNPRLARHGVDRGQLDSTARLIWLLERTGAAWDVHWPDPASLDSRRRPGSR
ncbi:MAG: acyl-CoA desaturase [Acidimicrobiales bacterium]